MTITKIPVRTVFDNSNNPVGLAEFQIGEVIAIEQGGTSANTVANARANLGVTDSNIRTLFSLTGGGTYNNTTGVFTINDPDFSPFAKTVDLTTANVIELTNLYFTNARATVLVTPAFNQANTATSIAIDAFGQANTATTIAQSAFNSANTKTVASDLTTANVIELTNLYFTNTRSRESISASGSINYNNSTGVISFTQGNTDTVVEGVSNLYFSNARAIGSLAGQAVSIGEATVTGNLFVLGNVVEFNTETLVIEDKNIVLANGSPTAASANGAGITVDGANASLIYFSEDDKWEFNKDLSVQGSIAATGNITSPFFYSESDLTLKENVNPIQDALRKILDLVGVDFVWKSTKQKSIGVVAQNVEKIVPEIVGRSSSGFKTVQYDSLIPILIEAIKEQQKQIDELRNKIK